MEKELAEVQTVRRCIADVAMTRAAHAETVSQKDVAVRDVNELKEVRAGVQARLTAREREIALSGAALPSEPFPEDAEIARLDRHIRILQERVRACEAKARDSQSALDERINELEEAWRSLGAAVSKGLLKSFQEAAAALRDTQLSYRALWPRFSRDWSSAAFKHFHMNLAIADPADGSLILNPMHLSVLAPSLTGTYEKHWPACALELAREMDELRGEIDAVKG